jgi:hypothetical protein
MPFEIEARRAAAAGYRPVDPRAPLIGVPPAQPDRAQTPIFDSISVWFADEKHPLTASRPGEPARVIDLRDPAGRAGSPSAAPAPAPAPTPVPVPAGDGQGGSGRWASLGDQRWIAANARAASAPETAGSTTAGLPRRRPGANLLPSASAAAGAPTAAPTPPARRTDAESVRGRLGSYQRGLSSARRARHLPSEPDSAGVFSEGTEAGHGSRGSGYTSGHKGGDS